MSDTVQNGKGSKPRNTGSRFKQNFDEIDWRPEYRLVTDNDNQPYVIRADECTVFYRWCQAMAGRRHFPANFTPRKIDGIHTLRFRDWREVEEGEK